MVSRFFVPRSIAPGSAVNLPEEASHHALRVLRLKQGDPVVAFDGHGGEWTAHIARVKPVVQLDLDSFVRSPRSPELRVTLVQSLPGADKMDWVIQKAVELGVAAIQPVAAKRSVVRLSPEKMQRRHLHWSNVAISACEQCGANVLPRIEPLLELRQYLGREQADNEARFLMLPGGGARLRDLPRPKGTVTVLVGPEGGFEQDEIDIASLAGFAPLSFGPRVLRTETAGLAMLASIMSVWGDC